MKNKTIISMLGFVLLGATTVFAQRGGRGFPPGGRGGGPPGPGGIERIADDIPFTSLQQGMDARSALAAYDQYIRQQTQQARAQLVQKMQTILTDSQFSQFKDELDQIPLVPGAPPQPRGVATSDLVDRLMSFDANQDGRITKDELPERMQNLVDEGDTNHDGALDKAEIEALAAKESINDQPPGRGGRGRRGGPPPGGFPQN